MIFMSRLKNLLQITNNKNMHNFKIIRGVLMISLLFLCISCNSQQKPASGGKQNENKEIKYKVTFIELGSVRCIP